MRETLPTALDDYGADQRFGLVGGASAVLFTTFYYFYHIVVLYYMVLLYYCYKHTYTHIHTHASLDDYGADQRFGLVGGAIAVLFTTFYYFTSISTTTTTTTHTHKHTGLYCNDGRCEDRARVLTVSDHLLAANTAVPAPTLVPTKPSNYCTPLN